MKVEKTKGGRIFYCEKDGRIVEPYEKKKPAKKGGFNKLKEAATASENIIITEEK